MFAIIAFMTGCKDDPTSPGDSLVITHPKDGYWAGQTSQGKDVSFMVSNKGTQVDSGFVITMSINEWWGYGYATYTRIKSIDIEEKKFSFDGSGISIQCEFENRTECTGNFAMSGTTGYPSYYSFSAAGTWEAEWLSSQAEGLHELMGTEALAKGKGEAFVEQQIDGNSKVIITYFTRSFNPLERI
jgi:hypothetical protein